MTKESELSHRLVLNAVGDVNLDDAVVIRVLADPGRYRLVETLRRQCRASSVELASATERTLEDVETDLAQLADVGLVVATGDEDQPWEAVGRGLFLDPSDDLEVLAAAKSLAAVMMFDLLGAPGRWADEVQPGLSSQWWRASGALNVGVVLSPDELIHVQAEIERVLEPFVNRTAAEHPAGGRRVRVLSFFMPDAA